jgi:hypothetical protein
MTHRWTKFAVAGGSPDRAHRLLKRQAEFEAWTAAEREKIAKRIVGSMPAARNSISNARRTPRCLFDAGLQLSGRRRLSRMIR